MNVTLKKLMTKDHSDLSSHSLLSKGRARSFYSFQAWCIFKSLVLKGALTFHIYFELSQLRYLRKSFLTPLMLELREISVLQLL